MPDQRNPLAWLASPIGRRFWAPRIGILIMMLGALLKVRRLISDPIYTGIEVVGVIATCLGIFYVVRSRRAQRT